MHNEFPAVAFTAMSLGCRIVGMVQFASNPKVWLVLCERAACRSGGAPTWITWRWDSETKSMNDGSYYDGEGAECRARTAFAKSVEEFAKYLKGGKHHGS